MRTERYVHDCTRCFDLGPFDASDISYDLYFCMQGTSLPTVLARFSDNGPDYLSGLEFGRHHHADTDHPLGEAFRRAKQKGLLI